MRPIDADAFTSEAHARDFMHLLAQLIGANDKTGGKDDAET